MHTVELKLLRILVIAFLIVYLLHQLYNAVYNPFSTDMAVYDSSYSGISLDTLFVRDETPVICDRDGYRRFAVEEGGKVAKNGVIAEIYASEEQAGLNTDIQRVQRQIERLETTQNYTEYNNADLTGINRKIESSFNELLDSGKNGVLTGSAEPAEDLLQSLNRKNIMVGAEKDFSARIEQLKSQKSEMESRLSETPSELRAESSGYFLSETDGYETVLSVDRLAELTPEAFDRLQPAEVDERVIGKIVSDYEWYIVAKVKLADSFQFTEGDSVTLKTEIGSARDLSATIESINRSGDSAYAVVVFSCATMNKELATVRRQKLTMVTESYSGLKVKKAAIRISDGVQGVYTCTARQVHFVPVHVLYTGDTFVICEKSSEQGSLRLYDEVIVKGKGLYDGKILS